MNQPYDYYKHKYIHNLNELLELSIEENASDTAFFYQDKNKETIYKTYLDFYDEVHHLKNVLAGTYKKKHIAIIGENSYEWVVYFLGIILSGNVAVVIDKDLPIDKIKELLKISNTKIAFYSSYSK